MHNETVYVKQNELNPWVRKRNEIKFMQGNYFIWIRPTRAYVLFQPGNLRASHKTVFIYLHDQFTKLL